MAIWQAPFAIIPTGAFPADYQSQLDQLLSRYVSWSSNIEAWGEEDGNRVEIYVEDGRPVEGSIRVDCRHNSESFVIGVITMIRDWGFMLESEQGLGIEPEIDTFARALEGSRAFRFIRDPEAYLRRLQIAGLEDT